MVLFLLEKNLRMEILNPTDSDEIFQLIQNNREHLAMYLDWVEKTKSIQDIQTFIEVTLDQFKKMSGIHYKIILDQQIIGIIGFILSNEKTKTFEIGCWIDKGNTQKGIASKCALKAEKVCFEHFRAEKVEMKCATENQASNQIAQKLKYKLEGTIRKSAIVKNQFLSYNIYGKIREEMNL